MHCIFGVIYISFKEESHISRLPLEILAIIVSYCCWKTKLFLLATNSFLNRFVAQSILELPFAVSDDSSVQGKYSIKHQRILSDTNRAIVIRRFTCLKHVTLTGKVSEEGLQYLPSLVQLESLKVEKANYVPQQLLSFLQPLQKLSSLSINFVPHLTTIDVPLTQLTRLELIDQFSIEVLFRLLLIHCALVSNVTIPSVSHHNRTRKSERISNLRMLPVAV